MVFKYCFLGYFKNFLLFFNSPKIGVPFTVVKHSKSALNTLFSRGVFYANLIIAGFKLNVVI